MPQIGIVISNYNGWRDTLACLESLRRQTVQDFEILLLDDASTDDSVEHLRGAVDEKVVFLPQAQNRGFAAANNIGMRRALQDGVRWVLLLNNDTVCRPDMLEQLLQNTPQGCVSCPKMLFMEPADEIWFAGGTLDRATGKVVHLGGHQKDGPAFSLKKKLNFITFCCVLLPREVIERVGYLDEQLFMYCEDVDYCIRLADAGVEMWYIPQAVLHHKAGGTAGGLLNQYYITRNTLYLRQKYAPSGANSLYAAFRLVTASLHYAAARLAGRPNGRGCGCYRGARDYFRGIHGRMPD